MAKIIITRPAAQAAELGRVLTASGYETVCFPLLNILPLPDRTEIETIWQQLSSFSLVVFVSPNAVDAFMGAACRLWPPETVAAAVGFAGAQQIRRHLAGQSFELIAPGIDDQMDSEALLSLIDVTRFKGKKALLVRGQTGRELIASQLVLRGMKVQALVSYRRLPPEFNEEMAQQLRSLLSEQNEWVITSSESLRFLLSFAERLGEDHAFVAKLQSQRLIVPHARIAETARQSGFVRIELTGSGDQNLMIALSNRV